MKYEKVNQNSPRQQAKRRGIRGFYMTDSCPRTADGKPKPFRRADYLQEVLEQAERKE